MAMLHDAEISADAKAAVGRAKAAAEAGDVAAALAALRQAVRPDSDFVAQARAAKALARLDTSALGLRPLRIAILAGSTVDHLAQALRLWLTLAGFAPDIHLAPFDTATQTILDPESDLYRFAPQVVWLFSTHRDLALPVEASAGADEVRAAVEAAIEERRGLWRLLRDRLDCLVLQNNADIPARDPFGNLSGAAPWGQRSSLRLYNALLAAATPPGVTVFDLDHVASLWGKARWTDPRYWFHSKHAFSLDATGEVAASAARLLAGAFGLAKKCLVLDLDNTLWGGVIGDDGLAGIELGSGTAGEAFVAFQHYVKALGRRGVILAVCSKNDPAVAREPFERHPDMVLSLDDIAVFRASWSNKAEGLQEIAATLDIGLDSLVFVDDNPAERDLIRRELPMVEVIELPEDPAFYLDALAGAGSFETLAFSAEDRRRGRYYAENARRAELARQAVDMDAYLSSLEMAGRAGPVDDLHRPRVAQLINKSNQFHLTGTRLSESEVLKLEARPDIAVRQFKLRDRFGDSGLIAAVVLRQAGEALHVDTWAMSCRVLGRTVEEFIANEMLRVAVERGCRRLVGCYRPSPRNGLVSGLYQRLGFSREGDDGDAQAWVLALDAGFRGWPTHVAAEKAAPDHAPAGVEP